jgi:signal transduction histidine kinase
VAWRELLDGATVLDRQRLSVVVRGGLVLLCAGLSVVESVRPTTDPGGSLGRLAALLTIGIMVAVLAAIRPSATWVPVLEASLVSLLAMADQGPHQPLLPYLLAPALDAGLLAGIRTVIYAVGASSAMILLARLVDLTDRDIVDYGSTATEWVLLALLTGGLATWARRLGLRTASRDEPYPAAFRLVSQLRTVARHLPSGLDAVKLAQILLQDLSGPTSYERGAVFIPGPAGTLVPLASAGHVPDWNLDLSGDSLVAEAWSHQRPATATLGLNGTSGLASMVLPLTLGARTVGIVALERRGRWIGADPADLHDVLAEAALRIETALLFAETRAIATSEERRRLAREIHDGIAQELAFLGYLLDDLSARAAQVEIQEELQGARAQITRVVGDLRMSIFELRSEVVGDAGLGSALSDFVRSVGTSSAMTVHLVLDESRDRLPIAAETELLRIAQESINNARKHASAENLWVTVSVHPPRASLIVEDDGRGMRAGRHDSYGLQIMRERSASLGADLSITERPGGGTRVEVAVGFSKPASEMDEHEVSERP